MVKLCTCRVPRGTPPGACQLCGRAIGAPAPVSPHAATLDDSVADARGGAGADADAGLPRPSGPPLQWNELSMVVPQEVLRAGPEQVVAGRYVRIGRRPIGGGS